MVSVLAYLIETDISGAKETGHHAAMQRASDLKASAGDAVARSGEAERKTGQSLGARLQNSPRPTASGEIGSRMGLARSKGALLEPFQRQAILRCGFGHQGLGRGDKASAGPDLSSWRTNAMIRCPTSFAIST